MLERSKEGVQTQSSGGQPENGGGQVFAESLPNLHDARQQSLWGSV